jgi:hypothetical protein
MNLERVIKSQNYSGIDTVAGPGKTQDPFFLSNDDSVEDLGKPEEIGRVFAGF